MDLEIEQNKCLSIFNDIKHPNDIKGVKEFMTNAYDFNNNILKQCKLIPSFYITSLAGELLLDGYLHDDVFLKRLEYYDKGMFCLIYNEKKYYILTDIIRDLDFDKDVCEMTLVKEDRPDNPYNYIFKLTNVRHEYYHLHENRFFKEKIFLIKSIIDCYKNKYNIKMITLIHHKYYNDASISDSNDNIEFYYPLSMIPNFLVDCVDNDNRLEITLLKYSWW